MTNTLEDLRIRFPKARLHYPPNVDCKKCGGSGIVPACVLPSGTHMNEGPCACVFLGPNTKWLAPLIAQSARRALAETRTQ